MTGPQGMGPLARPRILSAYDSLLATMGPIFEIRPSNTLPTYTAWETRTYAYANDMALESVRGGAYFRVWAVESGNLQEVEDNLALTSFGSIFRVDDSIV